jgi:hypothetical protein
MFKNFRDKVAISGITVLMIGVALLIFTFLSAYGFLTQALSIIASQDLVQTFGEALAPLIATCIHIMYLGVMGWVGSLLTIRGVTIIAHAPQTPPVVPQKPVAAQPKPLPAEKAKVEPQKEVKPEPKPEVAKPEPKPEAKPEVKPEAKPSEPEIIVIPPEQISQPEPQPEKKETQNNNAPPPQQPSSQ